MAFAESLERRQMFSAAAPAAAGAEPSEAPPVLAVDAADVTGPRLTSFRILGGPLGVDGVRLSFDEPIDAERARREGNYILRGEFTARDSPDPQFDEDFFEEVDDDDDDGSGGFNEVAVDQANYDDAAREVTLRVDHPFLLSHLRTIYIRSGPDGLRDEAGNFLDGDGDGQPGGIGIVRLRTTWGRKVRYFDSDGDSVRLRLRGGPGRLFVFRHLTARGEGRRPGDAVQVWVSGKPTSKTTLSGDVAPSARGGNGSTPIAEILKVAEAQVELLSDPRFQVGTVIP